MKRNFTIADDNQTFDVVLHENDVIDLRLINAIYTCYHDDTKQNQHLVMCALTSTANHFARNYYPISDLLPDFIDMMLDYANTLELPALILNIDANF